MTHESIGDPIITDIQESNVGIPDSWFTTFIDINSKLPQGNPAIAYWVGFQIFDSIYKGEIDIEQAFQTRLSDAQIAEALGAGNYHHVIANAQELRASEISHSWDVQLWYLSRLRKEMDKWEGLDPQNKIGVIRDLLSFANTSMELPGSQEAASNHKNLVIIDKEYRDKMCAQEALRPLYRNVALEVERKALELEEEKSIQIPSGIKNWFVFEP